MGLGSSTRAYLDAVSGRVHEPTIRSKSSSPLTFLDLKGPSVGPVSDYYPATVIPTMGAFRCFPPMEPKNGAL